MEKTEQPFSCGFCQALFSSTKELLFHICTEHDSVKGMDFETFNKIANKPFVCAICSEPFAVDVLISKHVAILHSSKIKRNIEVIDISSDDEEKITLLEEHELVKQKEKSPVPEEVLVGPKSTPEASEPPIEIAEACETSKATFEARDSPKSANEVCDPFEMVDILGHTNSSKTHLGKTPNLTCSKCPKSFRFKAFLKNHEQYFHRTFEKKDYSRYQCKKCNLSFKNRKGLLAHNEIHPKKKPFRSTTHCDQNLDGKEMIIHERIHSGERPYQCEVCQVESISLTEHKAHREAFHE